MSIPALLIQMANHIRSYTIANFVFKSLSIFNIVVAATRLAIQYDSSVGRIQYTSVTFMLIIEAAIAFILVSISSYRIVVLDLLAGRQRRKINQPTPLTVRQGRHPTATADSGDDGMTDNAKPPQLGDGSLSDLPMLSTT